MKTKQELESRIESLEAESKSIVQRHSDMMTETQQRGLQNQIEISRLEGRILELRELIETDANPN